MSDYLYPYSNCGCPKREPDQEEVERVIREIEEEPIAIPVTDPDAIPVPTWPIRTPAEVEVV